jgi:hypothetical protein
MTKMMRLATLMALTLAVVPETALAQTQSSTKTKSHHTTSQPLYDSGYGAYSGAPSYDTPPSSGAPLRTQPDTW